MPDYLEFSQDTGLILKKLISVDPSRVEGLTVKEVTRAEIESLDISLKKIVNGNVVDKSQVELDAEKAIKDAEKTTKDLEKQAVIADLKKLGLKIETITYLITPRR